MSPHQDCRRRASSGGPAHRAATRSPRTAPVKGVTTAPPASLALGSHHMSPAVLSQGLDHEGHEKDGRHERGCPREWGRSISRLSPLSWVSRSRGLLQVRIWTTKDTKGAKTAKGSDRGSGAAHFRAFRPFRGFRGPDAPGLRTHPLRDQRMTPCLPFQGIPWRPSTRCCTKSTRSTRSTKLPRCDLLSRPPRGYGDVVPKAPHSPDSPRARSPGWAGPDKSGIPGLAWWWFWCFWYKVGSMVATDPGCWCIWWF